MLAYDVLFFFSSRRRHTRWNCDWSSDVCSSDLRGEVKRFSPDAWLVYASSVQYPDLFGWWQHPKRYVLLGCEGSGEQRVKALPRPWRDLFTFAFRKSLKRADKVIAVRTMGELGGAMQHLRGWGVPEERICFLPLAVKTWTRLPGRE